MRVLTIICCLMLMGCVHESKLAKDPLWSIKGEGVNTGHNPPVTEMHEIKGELYIY